MKKILAPIALFLLLATSCKKEDPNNNVTIPTYKTYSSIDEIFNELSLKPKVVSIDAATGGSFYGNSGTRYIFQPNCFADATGATITGNVQIEVTEWLNKSDMMFSGVLPISNGEPLVSGGEVFVKATKAGKELFLKPGKTFQANIPQSGTADTTMGFFKGQPMAGDAANKVNWVETTRKTTDTTGTWAGVVRNIIYKPKPEDTLRMISDSIQFCNADRFMSGSINWQNFKITIVANGVTISDTDGLFTYALYDNQKSLWKCGWYGAPVNNVYSEHHIPDIPCHFVSYALIKGHFYGGVLAATPKTGENYTVTLTEVDPKEFKAQMALYK